MKRSNYLYIALLAIVGFALNWGCQTKEMTSAKLYMKDNNWDRAIEQLEAASQANSIDPEVYYHLGRGYATKGRWEDMVKSFEKSLELGNKFEVQIQFEKQKYWAENYNKGIEAFNSQNFEEAAKVFNIAALVDPQKVETFRNLAIAYVNLEQFDKAEETLDKAIALEPGHLETLKNKGIMLFQAKQYEKSIVAFKKLLELDNTNVDAISNIAIAYDQLGQSDKAIESYRSALELNPDDAALAVSFANLFFNRSEFLKAAEQYKKVLVTEPENVNAILQLGDSYLHYADGLNKKARALAEEDDKNPKIQDLRSEAKTYFQKALPHYEKSKDSMPDNNRLWYNLGIVYAQIGENKKSAAAFAKADELEKANK